MISYYRDPGLPLDQLQSSFRGVVFIYDAEGRHRVRYTDWREAVDDSEWMCGHGYPLIGTETRASDPPPDTSNPR